MVGVRKAGVIYDKILYRNERNQKKYDVRCIAESLPEKKDLNQKRQDKWV